jgi:hypothetical protein
VGSPIHINNALSPDELEKKKEEKRTFVSRCQRECELVNLMLTTIVHDTIEGVLPLLRGGLCDKLIIP